MKFRIGDTLVEVTLALGIFSMVAVAVVSVVSASTSSAQSSLESTVAREEVDVQAEALRFIHESYISGGQNATANAKYVALWNAIVKNADKNNKENILHYAPSTCAELYDFGGANSISKQNAFIINARAMGGIDSTANKNASKLADKIVIRPTTTNSNIFAAATTYPRLVYDKKLDTDEEVLYYDPNDYSNNQKLYRAEGIFIVAVKDNSTTAIVNKKGQVKNNVAYYDFYIRTCWFGVGESRPSTISTVVRLYDPSAIE